MHRSPAHFSHPDRFWPERWLLSPSSSSASDPEKAIPHANIDVDTDNITAILSKDGPLIHDPTAFLPFSSGPMNCAGKHLALLEIRTVVIAVLQRFRVRRARLGSRGRSQVEGKSDEDADVESEEWLREYERAYKDHFVSVRGRVGVILEERVLGGSS